jgi:hypothetical protein
MPGLTCVNILGHLYMMAQGKKLPTQDGWVQPQGDVPSRHYDGCMSILDKIAIPKEFPPIFTPQNANKYHQECCDKVGKALKDFHDAMTSAVSYAVMQWKTQAKYKDLKVNALTALGTPGCLDGPELESYIKNAPSAASMTKDNEKKWRDAVAKGVSKCFKDYQGQVMVPGLPWFPAFVAWPGPMAPPMPCVPVPHIATPSPMMTNVALFTQMKSAMVDALSDKSDDPDKHHEMVFGGIATVLALAFTLWMPMQMVQLVMGKGQVPSFAPPFVPVGPVVMGDNLAIPGHLIA